MIAKGGPRSGPRDLALYLMRLERWDTGEPVELLELRSPWAAGDPASRQALGERVIETFRDWQDSCEATKQGRDGLYHAQISPAPKYAKKMTPAEWLRTADILEQKLGLQGQDRAVFLHAGTKDRPHLHVVWSRTDLETMTLISDSYNYPAHERASLQMEKEFGHDFVPGKHAKRDRVKQPDFPRQKFDQADAQIAQREGLTVGERKEQIAAIKAAAANALEFKKGLEQAGYVLAQGKRGYLVVDPEGVHSMLSRNIGMDKSQVEAFMAEVPLAGLPTIEQAQELQKERAQARAPEPEEQKPPRRGSMTIIERKEQISTLRQQSDNAQSFKSALESAGYVLARGERQGFHIVDGQGEAHFLSRHIDIRGKDYKAFMAAIDPAALPTVDEAKEIQLKRLAENTAPGPEASKFLSPEAKQTAPEAAPPEQPAPTPKKKYEWDRYSPARVAEREAAEQKGAEASKFLQPPSAAPTEKIEPVSLEKQPAPQPAPPAPAMPELQSPKHAREIDPDRKTQITSLRTWADGAEDFKKSLENAGYTLAAGKGGYTLVDQEGQVFNLFAHIPENKIRLEAFMSPVPLSSLPTVEQVWEARKQKDVWQPPPPIADTPAGWAPKDQELYDLERAIAKRATEEMENLKLLHAQQLRGREVLLDRDIVERMGAYKAIQDEQLQAFLDTRQKERTGIWGVIDAIQSRLNPTLAAEKAQAREKEFRDFYRRLARERADYEVLLQQTKKEEMDLLHERQAYELAVRERKHDDEKDRYVREYHEGKRIAAEEEARRIHEELEKNDSLREGPPPPEPGK